MQGLGAAQLKRTRIAAATPIYQRSDVEGVNKVAEQRIMISNTVSVWASATRAAWQLLAMWSWRCGMCSLCCVAGPHVVATPRVSSYA